MSLLEVEDLRLSYDEGKTEALKGLTFAVEEGELFGVVGPDGAGKTTLIQILVGLKSFQGRAVFQGRELSRGAPFLRRSVGYISQRFSLYQDLSVLENVQFFGGLYPKDERTQNAQELLEFIGLGPFKKRLAGALSGGMKQKLALVCALIHGPELLLMDEPTVGVDPVSRREFWTLLFQLQSQGLTVISSTPYMDEAEQFDRVGLLNEGEFLQLGTVAELKESVSGSVLRVYSPDPPATRREVRDFEYVTDAQLFGDRVHVIVQGDPSVRRQELASKLDLPLQEIEFAEFSVEDIFLQKTAVPHG